MTVNLKRSSSIVISRCLLDANNDAFKTRLLEKKQQQWKQENCMFLIRKKNSYLSFFF
jgi:hypothetical protein